MDDFRMRQIHLDFHTSPAIDGIGEKFDKKEWQETLKAGHVDSITLFSKCHHGYSYHPTKVNEMHPGLKFDLLGAELEACKEIGVRTPVYISAGLDEKEAHKHPEWLARGYDDRDEVEDFSGAYYHLLCLNTPYLDMLLAEIEEVMERYDPCEVFLDILGERQCWCPKCRADMEKEGIDWHDEKNVAAFGKRIYRHYMDEVERVVRKHSDTCTVFHNCGHVTHGRRDLINTQKDLELESLPTGGWGYDHFPLSAAYVRTLGRNFTGMTGKFHKSWGEFGGFKHPNALRYEAALSLACGAGCSVGDQMHPNGRLNPSTYALIGAGYAEVEQKEKWCKGAKNISEIAVFSAESMDGARNGDTGKADVGANRILLETGRLYDFVDKDADISGYKLLILPDHAVTDEGFLAKVNAFLAKGGKLLLSGTAGTDGEKFLFDTGAKFLGASEFSPTYYIPGFSTVNGTTEYIMRTDAYNIEAVDAEILANSEAPYFNRTPEHFCSHQHAPNDEATFAPAVTIKVNIAYIGWSICKGYALYGDYHQKELVNYVIRRLMNDDFAIETSLPDRGICTLQETADGGKLVHLLFAHTTIRGRDTEVIEDVVPLYDIEVSVKAQAPSKLTLVPQQKDIPFTYENGKVRFTVPKIELHQMVYIK